MNARVASASLLLVGASLFSASSGGCGTAPAENLGIDHSPDTGSAGYCRTTTCQPPSEYPFGDQCEPVGWSDSETCKKKNESNAPVWWRSTCVGYDLNERASRKVSYEVFRESVSSAFAQWAGASCTTSGKGASRVSIDVRDLGAVPCARATYDKNGPNQSVIMFHDDAWPYEQKDRELEGSSVSLVIALTTVTYDPQSGEVYDADMEINSADYNVIPVDDSTAIDGRTYDLQTVLTHEAGHFLGLAHSPVEAAVMYKSGDTTGGSRKRSLTANDVRGLCAIYPPDNTRNVSPIVSSDGKVAASACDPTPRHGFTATCN